MSFVHLHVHSDLSVSEGASKYGALVDEAARLGQPALALTDTDNLYGALNFSKECASKGVQPIIGAQLSTPAGIITFLAQNEQGYRNLCALPRLLGELRQRHQQTRSMGLLDVLFSHDTHDGSKPPKLSQEQTNATLRERYDGLICLLGGRSFDGRSEHGVLDRLIVDGGENGRSKSAQLLKWLNKSIMPGRVYAEISRTGADPANVQERQQTIIAAAHDAKVPVVATSEVFYATDESHQAYEILSALNDNREINGTDDGIQPTLKARYHIRSDDEMAALFPDLPEGLRNAREIPQRCAFKVEPRDPVLPPYPTAEGRSENDELDEQAREGLKHRLTERGVAPNQTEQAYWERLDHELGIIQRMGFPGYFLIVSEFVAWAKNQDIPVGPARGSGAGSVVAWALRITEIDPLRFNLLFERFLNPERVSMPDFDIDFCQEGRDDVIEHVQTKYGATGKAEPVERIASIATQNAIKSKTALKDSARILAHEAEGKLRFQTDINPLTKQFPTKPGTANPVDLADIGEQAPALMEQMQQDSRWRLALEGARSIEGLYRQAGTHAAGIVIGDRPLNEFVPVDWDSSSKEPISQFDMEDVEKSGLVKFDFLGLKNLTIMKKAVDFVEQTRGGQRIDVNDLPVDDENVLNMLARGDTTGVFQLESGGMRETLRKMQPDRFEDIIAAVSLYRPGPMDNIPSYNARKRGEETPAYPAPEELTKPILQETYGIIVYQEQVMQIAQAVARYTLGQADILRKAMGKKKKEEMDKQYDKFMQGCRENGVDEQSAQSLWEHIEKFASYGFNKSHATAYATIAYQTAYLKYYYPAEFFAAAMTYEAQDNNAATNIQAIWSDLRQRGIELLRPDINRSYGEFRPEILQDKDGSRDIAVRFGFNAIKDIPNNLDSFLGERLDRGEFADLVDFSNRAGHLFTKKQQQRLATVGAFESLHECRRVAAETLQWLAKNKGQDTGNDLFGGAAAPQVPQKLWQLEEYGDLPDREHAALGFYLSGHPLDAYLPRLKRANIKRRKRFGEIMYEQGRAEYEGARMAVMVHKVQRRSTRFDQPMLNVDVSEKEDSYAVQVFDNSNRRNAASLDDIQNTLTDASKNAVPVVIQGYLSMNGDSHNDVRVRVTRAMRADDYISYIQGFYEIRLEPNEFKMEKSERDALANGAVNGQRTEIINRVLSRQKDNIVATLKQKPKTKPAKASRVRVVSNDGETVLFDSQDNPETANVQVDGATLQEIMAQPGAREVREIEPDNADY